MQQTMRRTWPLVVAIVLIAVYLRAPITGIGSLVNAITADLGLSATAAGLLTTIPLLAFAVVSLFADAFGQRIGAGYALLVGLAAALAGILWRSLGGVGGLFAGTVVIGCGIALGNVLLPALIKRFFPTRIVPMTSLYTTVMTGMGGVSAAIGMPLALQFGWRGALAVWALFCTVALLWWLPYRTTRLDTPGRTDTTGPNAAPAHAPVPANRATKGLRGPTGQRPARSGIASALGMARHRTAWVVALYMGMQSLLFYCFVAWFSPILQSHGMDAQTAGLLNALYFFIGVPGSLSVPVLARRFSSQSAIGAGLGLVYLVGMIAFALSDSGLGLVLTLLCCGWCQGACISFAMAQFGIHTADARTASALSAFGQSVGYLIAAVGPALLGLLVDATGTWAASHAALIVIAVAVTVLGWLVGRWSIIGSN